MEFTEKDIQQFESKGISKEKVLSQVETFKQGIPYVNLDKAAVVEEGILKFSKDEEEDLISNFEQERKNLSLLKFVPASGAASRMFKAMFNFIESYDPRNENLSEYITRTGDKAVKQFVDGIENLPFYSLIFRRVSEKAKSKNELVYHFVKEMLEEDGLNYGFYPKGLLPFHKYKTNSATPLEEHLNEASLYAKTKGNANLHFTISEQHDVMFKKEYENVEPNVSERTNTIFNVSYSNQKPSTDTLAVDMNNEPFRNADGSILFRPGGHGALIENLNDQDADIIFIKNIDNVVIASNLKAVSDSKKVLAGLLLKKQEKAFEYAAILDSGASSEKLEVIVKFLKKELNIRFAKDFDAKTDKEKTADLKSKINRPIRICGMVKNEGEPGGGPFWVRDSEGNISLQIIESAQINMDDTNQVSILQNSTHFNPVDLVCGIRNYKGEKYNLLDFVDTKQGFITGKTKEGKELKALELPGLWNGAMAYWNTIFVEVPLITFNPVKTVNDLLKPSHQV